MLPHTGAEGYEEGYSSPGNDQEVKPASFGVKSQMLFVSSLTLQAVIDRAFSLGQIHDAGSKSRRTGMGCKTRGHCCMPTLATEAAEAKQLVNSWFHCTTSS